MKLSDYPNDNKTKTFKNAVAWLNTNKRSIEKLAGLSPVFNKPFGKSSWGMPKTIFKNLKCNQITWLQEQTKDWVCGKTNTALDETVIPKIALRD